jgi:hypothetical protein
VGDWKLVHNGHVSAAAVEPSETEQWELFNIREDVSETRDMKDDQPEVFARLRERLARLAAEAVEPNISPKAPPDGFAFPEVWGRLGD